jgi:hypothetical protein
MEAGAKPGNPWGGSHLPPTDGGNDMPDKHHEPEDRAQEPEGKAERVPERKERPSRWQAARTPLSVFWFIARVALWIFLEW